MKNIWIILILLFSFTACQKNSEASGEQRISRANDLDGTPKPKGKTGPVDDVGQLNFPAQSFMSGAANLIQGAWVSQCYPATIPPHIPCVFRMPFYRMVYLLYPVDKNGNMLVQHFIREYNDPLCRDNFQGPFDPHTRKSVEIVGYYRVSDQSHMFPNVIQISFEWTQCSGNCAPPQSPVNGVYLNQVKVAAMRESEDNRQVLFWGDNFPARAPSPNPFLAEQIFHWNVPFYRLDF